MFQGVVLSLKKKYKENFTFTSLFKLIRQIPSENRMQTINTKQDVKVISVSTYMVRIQNGRMFTAYHSEAKRLGSY
jgi:hypothetical protein